MVNDRVAKQSVAVRKSDVIKRNWVGGVGVRRSDVFGSKERQRSAGNGVIGAGSDSESWESSSVRRGGLSQARKVSDKRKLTLRMGDWWVCKKDVVGRGDNVRRERVSCVGSRERDTGGGTVDGNRLLSTRVETRSG